MTMQVRDKLKYKNMEYSMRTLPLTDEKIKSSPLVSNGMMNTACWRGYVGTWEVKEMAPGDERLFLVSMDLWGFEPMEFKDIFPDASDDGLEASWVSGDIICDGGGVLRREPFNVIYNRTAAFSFDRGRLVSFSETENS